MLQKISPVLNIVLLVAVGVLFYLHFSKSCSCSADGNTSIEMPILSNSGGASSRILFVNSDSLLDTYDYYKDIKKQFEAKQERLEADMKYKVDQFQKEVEAFQMKAQTMSQEQAAVAGEGLRQREEQLVKRRDQLGAELIEEQQKLNVQLNDKVSNYLKELKSKSGYDYVFSKSGAILYANDSLDITKGVVKALNEKYKLEKKK